MNLGNIIKFHRKKSGLTQKELADLANVGKTAIFDLERGKSTVQFDTITKVLTTLNIDITYNSPIIHLMKNENEKS